MNITKGDWVRVDTAAYGTLPNPLLGTVERATWMSGTDMYSLTVVTCIGSRVRLWMYRDEITVLAESEEARDGAFTVVSNKDIGKELARVTAERDRLQAEVARLQSEVQRLWAHSFDAAELLDSIRRIVEGGEDA